MVMKYLKSLLLIILLTSSCTEDGDYLPPLCPDGNCDGAVFLPYPVDENGYAHVDLDFNTEFLPRFDIFIEGDDVDPYYYYNDIGVVQAAFESSSYWTNSDGMDIDLVQETTIYLNNSPNNPDYTPSISGRKWAKRIVGPIPPQFIGDTITINAEIYWDGGSKSKSQLFSMNIIIE